MSDAPWLNRIVGEGVVAAGDLVAHPQNWRQHPKAQGKQLAATLGGVGWVQRVIVNQRTGRMLDGHLRAELARQQGEQTPVPVVYVDLSEDEERTVLATLDPIANMAIADEVMLAGLVRSIEDADLRSVADDIAATLGIDTSEKPDAVDAEPQIDRAEELRQKWGVELGQMWQLGDHRLICGDCTDKAVVERVMGGEKADMVFTDPPYGYEYESNYYKNGNPFGKLENDDKILDFVSPILPFMQDNSAAYICAAHQTIPAWRLMLDGKMTYKNTIIWKKNNWSMGDLEGAYAGQWEALLFYHHGRVKLLDGRQRDVWEFDREPPRDHPTQKPVELVAFAIKNTATDGAIVLDPFSGSGTTLIACEQLGRRCRAVEISPGYVAVALERWSIVTAKVPVLVD